MAGKTPKKAITDTLASLSKDNLHKFIEELLDRRQEPRVKRNMVEGKSYLDVGNVLVDTFTEADAPGVVMELLIAIDCRKYANELAQETSGQCPKPGSSDRKHFVDKHFNELVARVSETGPIMDELLKEEFMTQEMYAKISAEPTSMAKMRMIYSGPLNAAGRRGKDFFQKLLEKYEKHLMEDL